MGVIKSKMGTIGSKIGRKFEQKRQAKWVKKKCKFGQVPKQHTFFLLCMEVFLFLTVFGRPWNPLSPTK